MNIVVTGGAGFIGSSFLLSRVPHQPEHRFITLDALTYAGLRENLALLEQYPNHQLMPCELADAEQTLGLLKELAPDAIVHLAAESHVDRSLRQPAPFIQSNVMGTFHVLEACRHLQSRGRAPLLLHVSTDEVYGQLPEGHAPFRPGDRYAPRNPYAATKAAADQLVRGWQSAYQLPIIVTHCTNNYGPRQFPEKLIPFMLSQTLQRKPLPLYGDGLHARDWLFVEDHVDGLWRALLRGTPGETYHFSAHDERPNRDVVHMLLGLVADETGTPLQQLLPLIQHVPDRPAHDRRYGLDTATTRASLEWEPQTPFEQGLRQTVRWYLEHPDWMERVRSEEHTRWLNTQYEGLHLHPAGAAPVKTSTQKVDA